MEHQHYYLKNSILELKNDKRFDTSLMIPMKLLEFVHSKIEHCGSFPKLLNFLILKHSTNLKHKSKMRQNVLTKYQEKNQDLKKFNLKPDSRDWHALKLMSNHLGVSASYLFVVLLKLELTMTSISKESINFHGKLISKMGVPTKFPIFRLLSELKFKQKNHFRLLSKFKIDS